MQKLYVWWCFCFILADNFVMTDAQPPTWDKPTCLTFTIDESDKDAGCASVTLLVATSGDSTTVAYSVENVNPSGGGFNIGDDISSDNKKLTCTGSLLTASSYTVTVTASQPSGDGSTASRDLVISVRSGTGPICTQETSLSVDLSDNTACDSVASLTCSSSDCSGVSYSVTSQTPSGGGFDVSGSTFTCSSATANTYTVVVSAQNTGDSAATSISFTITASGNSDVNECTSDTHNCDTNAICTNTVGSFTCACKPGYSGNGVSCTDVNECTSDTHNCDTNAICTNTVGSFTCACKPGYSGNGVSCTDVNECTSDTHNCDTNAMCANTVGSFTCACKPGYSGNGVSCTEDCNEPTARDNATIVTSNGNVDGSEATYTCESGYTRTAGAEKLTCTSGSWIGDLPTCSQDCTTDPESADNAQISKTNDNKAGSVATYSCTGGYTRTAGDATRTCTDGSWTGTAPTCSTGPEWTTEDSHKLIKDNMDACDQVTTLVATTTGGSSVAYSIVSQDPSEANFATKTEGNSILLTCTQSGITVTTYTVVVRAKDENNQLTTDLTLTIAVKVPPVFVEPSPDTAADEHKIYMCESLGAGDVIIKLSANDADGDSSRTFSMDESSEETKALFEIIGDELKVKAGTVEGAFDIDTSDATLEYPVSLKVSDGELDSTLNTTIFIEDDNDNTPVFSGSFSAEILETVTAGTSVLQVTAVDNDKTSENNNVTLTLSGDAGFRLDGDTIKVAEGTTFDVTTKTTYSVTITASDEVFNDTKSMTITVESEPKFDPLDTAQTSSVSEDATPDTEIYTVQVTDRDGTGTLNVTVVMPEDKFRMDGKILKLKQGESLDAENAQTIDVQFNATDEKYEVTSATLTLNITDVNDNVPEFKETDPKIDISETVEIGTTVYTVSATDKDISNPTLMYSLEEIGVEHFVIDSSTGVITTSAKLSFDQNNQFNVKLTVKDGSSASDKSASTVLTVHPKTAPTIVQPANNAVLDIAEDTADGTNITQILTSDRDGDPTTIELISQDPTTDPMMFAVQDDQLSTRGTFDVDADDAIKTYTLTLKVSGGRHYTNDGTVTFMVDITDSNDNTPEFSQDSFTENVMETAAKGTTVLRVAAMDKDDSERNNQITYSMPRMAQFVINESNGDISVADSLEYDEQSQYNVEVTATDNGFPAKSAVINVTLNILAEPTFENLAETKVIQIDENVPANTEVFKLNISDSDSTWKDAISISQQTPDEMFKLDGTTVETKTDGLDAEVSQEYTLKFKVTDGLFVVESKELKIKITDLNDNMPVIASLAPVTIPENKTLETSVIDIEATDDDVTMANNVLTYSIVAGNDDDIFKINDATGVVTLEKAPTLDQYNLKVNVSDSGSPSNTATTDVTINVNHDPVDECSPQNPCQNGGNCTPEVNTYSCTCEPGWNGTNCEINIDECSPEPCKNGGVCTDGINAYTCNCTEGWEGQTCTMACTNNKYGRNCEGTCNCNVTRLVSNVDNQQCDIKNGACKCNSYWTGAACETDVDECDDTSLCKTTPNQVCENIDGGYYCTCKQGYYNIPGNCIPSKSVVITKAGSGKVNIKIKSSLNAPCPELTKSSVYNQTKEQLELTLNKNLQSAERVQVTDIKCGSLTYETYVTIDESDVGKLSNEIESMRNNVVYNGTNVTVNSVEVNDNPLNKSTAQQTQASICRIYTSIESCARDEECKYENSLPSCKKIVRDNTPLILGLVLGVIFPLLLMAMLACLYFYCYRMKKRNRHIDQKQGLKKGWKKENSPWHGRLHSNGMMLNTRNYNRNQYYDNANFNGSSFDKQPYIDIPAVGYTTY